MPGRMPSLFVVVLLLGTTVAQEATVNQKLLPPLHSTFELPTKDLRVTSSVDTGVPWFDFFDAPQCDKDGAIFAHAARGVNYNNMEVLRLKVTGGEGKVTSYLAPVEFTGNKKGYFINFSVTPSGDLWMLGASSKKEYSLFKFDSEGNADETRLETPEHLDLWDIAVSDQSIAVVSGNFNRDANEALRGKRWIALFDASGKLLKQLDVKVDKVDPEDHSMHEGAAVFGDDGLLYVLLPQSILVISQSGTLEKRIPFERKAGTKATHLVISGGYLAVWLLTPKKNSSLITQFLMIDANTGESLALYNSTDETGNDALCYSRKDGFTMHRIENNRVKLLMVNAR